MADRLDARLAALNDCIEKLPARDRQLLRLRYASGASAKIAAEAVGLSVHAVYRALARIRDLLHGCVSRAVAQEVS